MTTPDACRRLKALMARADPKVAACYPRRRLTPRFGLGHVAYLLALLMAVAGGWLAWPFVVLSHP